MKVFSNILVIDEYGSYISKKYKRLIIKNKKKNYKEEVPIKNLRTVVILTKTSLSTEVIKSLIDSGVSIILCGYLGRPYAKISGIKIGGTSKNRKLQYELLKSPRSTEFVKKLIDGKIANQLSNIKYYAKSKRLFGTELFENKISKIENLKNSLQGIENQPIENTREKIMNIEALVAKEYFDFISKVYGKELLFLSRDYKSDDIFNTLLNIGYNMISLWYWIFVEHFSLDPFEGFLHVERPGRLSFVYDLMEPLRPIVDRLTLSFIFQNDLNNKTFERKRYKIIDEFKKYMIEQLINFKITVKNKKLPLRYIIFYQVESFVGFLYEKHELYVPRIYW